ncbi:hypothetical protein EDD86DRAFT_205479 [Gorgonomyces haynaldii]|nr:hypothetical protein EDD86DRAFT_205479 [Gorgonomyces haynaldii]
MSKRVLNPKPVLDEHLLREAFEAHGISQKHCATIWRYITHKKAKEFKDIPGIPKKALELLEKEFCFSTSKIVGRTDNKDKSTTKLLVELQDGQKIETVIMRYGGVELDSFPESEKQYKDGQLVFRSNKRATVCVSSQVGCAMGCTFCATGTMNLLSNLTSGEILEQLFHATEVEKIRNVVFMGMGEPLDNYSQVVPAVRAMLDPARFGLAAHRVSVSTVGVVPRMIQLKNDLPDIGLALSLHAPNQELRTQIVPTSKAWPLPKIMEAMDAYIAQQNQNVSSVNARRHVLVEYVLIADVNDAQTVAHELGQLLKDRDVLLNVIPYNPTDVPYDYKAPEPTKASAFVETVRSYGVRVTFRQEFGQDIASACGQLVINSKKCVDDIEDIGKPKTQKTKIVKRKSKPKPDYTFFYALIVILIALLVYRFTQ